MVDFMVSFGESPSDLHAACVSNYYIKGFVYPQAENECPHSYFRIRNVVFSFTHISILPACSVRIQNASLTPVSTSQIFF